MKRLLLLALPLLFLGAAPGGDSPSRIAADFQQYRMESEPSFRLRRGLRVDTLSDLTEEGVRKEILVKRSLLDRLARLDSAGLSHEDDLTLQVLRWSLEQDVRLTDHLGLQFLVTPHALPLSSTNDVFWRHAFAGREDLDHYLRLLRQYPGHVRQIQAWTERQRARGVLVPKETVDQVVPMIRSYIGTGADSLFTVSPERLKAIGPKDAEAFSAEVAKLVQGEVNPSLERLASYLEGDYRKAAPDRVGLGQYPGGPAFYRDLIRYHTGLDLTPEQIHQRGLDEVARIEGQMAEIRRQLGFQGTLRQFNDSLRTDPRFLAKTPEEVESRLMAPIRRIEPLIGRYFQRLPKAPYGVRRLDPSLEGSWTFGFYQLPTPSEPAGIYLFNGSKLDQRPLVGAAALIYHELLPGHHFQLALQRENEALPELRRELLHTAFVEGWGEYASELGVEMGLYDDPYSLYGRLAMDMFLSNRLVVDTGMNALGWPRSRAVEYMRDHLLESDVQIDSETLRYAVGMPGQALAYKMGSLKMRELRRRAEQELGPRFDIRRFHEALIGSGSLPLGVLEKHIDWWIAREKQADR
ncbi:MAG: DUF885 domain-containing protein [Acidobacteriota bacterium]